MKITIIGAGNMGGAIARGLAKGSVFSENDITVTARSQKTLDALKLTNPSLQITNDNTDAVKDADFVVLAVKPWLLESVIMQIRNELDFRKQIILSVVAAVTFDDLQKMLDHGQEETPVLYRIIPNTAIAIRQSMTIISSFNATDEQDHLVKSIFDELGHSVLVEERLMGAGTAICSCGIAYALKYVQAAVDGSVELGFYPNQAKDMIAQTVKGAVELLLANGSMPEQEIYKVTTPGGITIKGLNEMEAQGFSAAIVKGLKVSAG